jgi:hypothetical protein
MFVRNIAPAKGSPVTVTAPVTPYVTLLGFSRYVSRTGPAKAVFVGGLRRQRASGTGFNPHGPLVKALKADLRFRTPGIHLAHAVDLVKPRWRPMYSALVPGAVAYLDSLGDLTTCHLATTRDALAMVGTLPVKINPHFGVRHEDGAAEVVRLHFDDEPPSDEAILATLHLMREHRDRILPGAEPVLVDLRRAAVHRAAPATVPGRHAGAVAKPDQVAQWLAGEAAAFAATWNAAA